MKQIVFYISVLLAFSANTVHAQRGKSKDNVDLNIAVVPSFASIPRTEEGLSDLMLGGKIGATFHERKDEFIFPAWSVGLYGSFLSPMTEIQNVTENNIAVTESRMNIRDAGIYFDFVPVKIMDGDLFSDEGTQFFVSVPIQWGLLSEVRIYDYDSDSEDLNLIERSNFMKLEPGINLNVTLSKFAIISGGVSYQWTYLWNKPLENIQEWPDLGIFKINLSIGVRIALFN